MLVNSIDITTYHAKLLNKDIQTATIIIFDDWLRKALTPLYLGKQETFKSIKMQFVIEDTTDDACLMDISNLISQLKKCTVKFDDTDRYYDCTIASTDHGRLVETGYFAVNVELKSGYAYEAGVTATMDHVDHIDLAILGNLPSPAKVTVTVPINTISLTITGFEHDIIISNLLANVPVIIDGELGTILQNGSNKFAEVNLWGFPVLQPGANIIAVSSTNCVITILYKPKYI